MKAWLIEWNTMQSPEVYYWTGDHVEHDCQDEWSWDHLNAVRFTRKEDAEMGMVGVLGLKLPSPNVHATEHQWED